MRGLISKGAARWRDLNPAERVRVVCGLLAAGVLVYLLAAPKPWLVEWPAPEDRIPLPHYVAIYSWWGGLIAFAGISMLGLTARWWTEPLPPSALEEREAERAAEARRTPRWFWPLVGVAMLVMAVLGAQRLPLSLAEDETYTVRNFAQGDYRSSDDGSVRFRERGLTYAFHGYRMPNNHILHTLLVRVAVAVWKPFRDPSGPLFSETVVRFPAFLAAIAAVGALAWLLKELGLARAGVCAAFLLAVHPWFLRYAAESRGYSMVFFLLPVLLVFWLRAMRTGAWRWWISVGAAEFAILYTYPGMLYPVVALNLITLLLMLARRPLDVAPWVPLGRWLVTGLVAALAFTWLFLPCVPQMQAFLQDGMAHPHVPMGRPWIQNFAAYLFGGAPWLKTHDPAAIQPELHRLAREHGFLYAVLLASAAALIVLGAARWVARGWLSSSVGFVLIVPAVVTYVVSAWRGIFLYEWYLIYLLAGVVALMATGLDTLALPWRRKRWSAAIPATLLAAFVAGYLVLFYPVHHWLLTRSLQPLREAAMAARGTTLPNYPGYQEVVTTGWRVSLYDPHFQKVDDFNEFLALMASADAGGKEVYVHLPAPELAGRWNAEIYRLVTQSRFFEIVATFPAFEAIGSRAVARYVRGSLADGLPPEDQW